jgi:methionine synthase II (cobalamin-independent)
MSFGPPFRADHIGSLLRPPALKTAVAAHAEGRLDTAALLALEDELIDSAIALQESVGLESITDGEFRRTIYFGHFPAAVAGFTEMESELDFRDADGRRMKYRTPVVTGRLRRERGIATAEYSYVQAHTKRTPKVTLPSPCSQHYFRWRDGVSNRAYANLDEFFTDVAQVYREELAALAALGARYVQLDDVSLPLLCDTRLRAAVAARGYDPGALVAQYIAACNAALAQRPSGLSVGMHLCRGNNQGKWLGEGGYEAVAEQIFTGLELDFLCLEYDSARAGSFEPLRFVPADRVVVLGLISTKTAALESPDALRRRLDEAARYVPMERLCLSPQCGFASTMPGNPLSADDQRRKLELLVTTAHAVWG